MIENFVWWGWKCFLFGHKPRRIERTLRIVCDNECGYFVRWVD